MSAAGRIVSPLAHLLRSGVVPIRPDRAARALAAVAAHGQSMATLLAVSAALDPDGAGLTDHRGSVTTGELWDSSLRLAAHLAGLGVGRGDAVAVVARNHRGFVIATMAASRCGADVVLVNTEMSTEQYKTVLDRHHPAVVLHDPEFAEVVERACPDARRISTERGPAGTAGTGGTGAGTDDTGTSIDEILAGIPHRGRLRPVHKPGRLVLLTSGTTGTAKSAPRSLRPETIGGLALSAVAALRPRRGEHMYIASPFFHGFGLLALLGALGFGNSIECTAGFDAHELAERMGSGDIDVLAAVPAQLVRALEANGPRARIRRILTGASPVPVELTRGLTEKHGSCVVVGYGSTEAGIATLAGPDELEAAPGTVGPAVLGLRIRILREDRTEAAVGETGTIFVHGAMRYDGYSGADDRTRDKEVLDGYLNTGDLGHLDEAGRLFVAGREDDMIVTGGENVFATEVEAVLADHPAVAEAAVGGVDDQRLGTRMRAYLVLRPDAQAPTLDEVKAHVRTRLEKYKSPREVVFVAELPHNPSGKLQRFRLPDLEVVGTAAESARDPETDPTRSTSKETP